MSFEKEYSIIIRNNFQGTHLKKEPETRRVKMKVVVKVNVVSIINPVLVLEAGAGGKNKERFFRL